MNIYIFHRSDGFYPLELKDDTDAIANAKCNPGTLKVENTTTGKVVWMLNDELSERRAKDYEKQK